MIMTPMTRRLNTAIALTMALTMGMAAGAAFADDDPAVKVAPTMSLGLKAVGTIAVTEPEQDEALAKACAEHFEELDAEIGKKEHSKRKTRRRTKAECNPFKK